jgi:hypothetical protein
MMCVFVMIPGNLTNDRTSKKKGSLYQNMHTQPLYVLEFFPLSLPTQGDLNESDSCTSKIQMKSEL